MERGLKLRLLLTVSAAALGAAGLAACADLGKESALGAHAVVSLGSQKDGASLSVSMTDPYDMGKAYLMAGQTGLAIDSFLKAVSKNPKSVQALNALAATYDDMHRFDLADHYYNAALEIDPHSAQTLNNLGYSYLLRGDYAAAKQYLDQSKKLAAGNSTVNANLALAERDAKEAKAAPQDVADAKDKSPAAAQMIISAEPRPSDYPRIERTAARVQTLFTKPASPAGAPARSVPAAEVAVDVSGAPEHIAAVEAKEMPTVAPAPDTVPAIAKDATKDKGREEAKQGPEISPLAATDEGKYTRPEHIAPDAAPAQPAAKDEVKDQRPEHIAPAAALEASPPVATDEAKYARPAHIAPDAAPAQPAAKDEVKDQRPEHIAPAAAAEGAPAAVRDETKATVIPVVTEHAASVLYEVKVSEPAPAKSQVADAAKAPEHLAISPAKVEAKFVPEWDTAPPAGAANAPRPAIKVAESATPQPPAQKSPQPGAATPACTESGPGSCLSLTERAKERFHRSDAAVREAGNIGEPDLVPSGQDQIMVARADDGEAKQAKSRFLPASAAAPGLHARFSQSVASVIEALGGCKVAQRTDQGLCSKLGLYGGQLAQSPRAKESGNVD
jgi:Flp pilus assembly protein TadD